MEIEKTSKIRGRSEMLLRSISMEEDQDLTNPPPSKKARTKFDKFKLKMFECFLPPGGGFLNNEKKLKNNDDCSVEQKNNCASAERNAFKAKRAKGQLIL